MPFCVTGGAALALPPARWHTAVLPASWPDCSGPDRGGRQPAAVQKPGRPCKIVTAPAKPAQRQLHERSVIAGTRRRGGDVRCGPRRGRGDCRGGEAARWAPGALRGPSSPERRRRVRDAREVRAGPPVRSQATSPGIREACGRCPRLPPATDGARSPRPRRPSGCRPWPSESLEAAPVDDHADPGAGCPRPGPSGEQRCDAPLHAAAAAAVPQVPCPVPDTIAVVVHWEGLPRPALAGRMSSRGAQADLPPGDRPVEPSCARCSCTRRGHSARQ